MFVIGGDILQEKIYNFSVMPVQKVEFKMISKETHSRLSLTKILVGWL